MPLVPMQAPPMLISVKDSPDKTVALPGTMAVDAAKQRVWYSLGGGNWYELTSPPIILTTTGDTAPAVIKNPDQHAPGTLVVNTVDNRVWLLDPTHQFIELPMKAALLVAPAATSTPLTDPQAMPDPATGVYPPGVSSGSMYINPYTSELYVATPTPTGLAWIQASVRPAVTVVHDPAGGAPAAVDLHGLSVSAGAPGPGGTEWEFYFISRTGGPGQNPAGEWLDIRYRDAQGVWVSLPFLSGVRGGHPDAAFAALPVHPQILMPGQSAPTGMKGVRANGDGTYSIVDEHGVAPQSDPPKDIQQVIPPGFPPRTPAPSGQRVGSITPPPNSVRGAHLLNSVDGRNWVYDGTAWLELTGGTILVPNEAARLALPSQGVPDDVIVVQQDTGWTWRYDATLAGDPFWSPWRVFSDYVSVENVAAMTALIPHVHIGTMCGVGTNGPTTGPAGTVGDYAIYQLLPDPRPGTHPPVWMAMLPQVQDAKGNLLQTLSYDPARAFGERVIWEDDRTRLEVVANIADLSDRTLLPQNHLAAGKLVFVRAVNRIYQYMVDVDAQPTPEVPTDTITDWSDINTARNAPGLEGVIVPDVAPNDPGTVKWAGIDAGRLAITPPGGYFVVASAQTPVPAGVPSIAGQDIKAGDWVVAIDMDGDGTSDAFHIVSLPISDRPLVTVLTVAGASIDGTPTRVETWAITGQYDNNPPSGTIHAGDAAFTTVTVSSNVKTGAVLDLLPHVPPGTVVRLTSTADPTSWVEFVVASAAHKPGTPPDTTITVAPGSLRRGPGASLPQGTPTDVDLTVSTPLAGDRDDVVYNAVDYRFWIRNDHRWVEIGSPPPQVYVVDTGEPVADPVVLDGTHPAPWVGWVGSLTLGFGHERIWDWLSKAQGTEPTVAYFVDESGKRLYELTDDGTQVAGANIPAVLTDARKVGEWVTEAHAGGPAPSGGRIHADAVDATMTTIGLSTTAVALPITGFVIGPDLFPAGSTVKIVSKADPTSFVEFPVGTATLGAGVVTLTKGTGNVVLGAGPAVFPSASGGNVPVDVLVTGPTPVRTVAVRTFEIASGWAPSTGIYNVMFDSQSTVTDPAASRVVLNQDGTVSVKSSTQVMQVRVQGTGGPFLPTFNLATGVPTKSAGVKYHEGDEFVSTRTQRNWVFDGTAWVERAHPTHLMFLTRQADADPASSAFWWEDAYKPEVPVGTTFLIREQINTVPSAKPGAEWITVDGTHLAGTSNSIPGGTIARKTGPMEITETFRPALDLTPLQLYITVPATGAPHNAMAFSTYHQRGWADFPVGVPAVIREVDANGLLPTMSGLPNLSGKPARAGDWLVPIDKDHNGVADEVVLVRQGGGGGPMVHYSQPAETSGQIFLDRGLAAFGLTTANDAIAQDAKLDGIWEAYITGVCRSATDLYLIMHDPDFPGPTPPADAPMVDRAGKKAVGPWNVRAQSEWTIKVIGNSLGYGGWEVTFSGQDGNGHRTFDMVTYNRGSSGRSLPAFGVEAAAGNVYLNRVMFRMNRESQ